MSEEAKLFIPVEENKPPTAIDRLGAAAARANDEDLDIVRRAATMQGTGTRHSAATARVVLDLVQGVLELAGGGAAKETVLTLPPTLITELERIEEALRATKVADLAALEETIGALTARVASLEAELGTAPQKEPPAPKKDPGPGATKKR